jgi:hypothetical protein
VRRDRLALLSLVLIAGLFAAHAMVTSSAVLDDAYISFRYARNLATGRGLAFNPGEHVEGYTNFSWVLLAALAERLGLGSPWVMPLVGLVAGIALVAFAFASARSIAREEGDACPFAGVPAACVLAASPTLASYAGTGLETALYALLATMTCVAIARRRAVPFAFASAAAFLTRPEGALLGLVGLGAFVATRDWKKLAVAGSALGAIVIPYLVWKEVYFGSITPNTLAAKPPDLRAGLSYVGWALPEITGFVVAAVLASRSRPRLVLLALWGAQVLGALAEGGDWMPGQRFLVPALGSLAIAADREILGLFMIPRRPRDAWRPVLLLLVFANVPLAAYDTRELARMGQQVRDYDAKRAAFVRAMQDAGVQSVGTLDIGLPSYLALDIDYLDLGGLTDRTIARSPGRHEDKEIATAYLDARSPDAFVFVSRFPAQVATEDHSVRVAGFYPVEKRVMGMPWFGQHYRYRTMIRLEPDYYMAWFERWPPAR